MRKFTFLATFLWLSLPLCAQKIIPITIKGQNYEVIDLSSKDNQMWGGYEEIPLHASSSESNGKLNTESIQAAVGDNKNYYGRLNRARGYSPTCSSRWPKIIATIPICTNFIF